MPIAFVKEFDPSYGKAVRLSPFVRRLTVKNPSALTFTGTNTYIVGKKSLAIIDPGPIDEEHYNNLIKEIDGHMVSHIFVTHCHMDHSPLSKKIAQTTGAIIVAEGPYRASRPRQSFDTPVIDDSVDMNFKPDQCLKDNETISGEDWRLTCVTTPGHMENHAGFCLEGTGILFSGDHVMSWATTVVAPPDGSMRHYMASLDKLLLRNDQVYLPGHGGPVYKPLHFTRALKAHRKMRERAIIQCLQQGQNTIKAIVDTIYRDINPKLYKAASLSVLAHLEDMVERHQAYCDGEVKLDSVYSAS